MVKPGVSVDKLYLLAKLVRNVRKRVSDEETRTRLRHWEQLLNELIQSGGNTIIPKLRRICMKQKIDVSEDVEQMMEAFE